MSELLFLYVLYVTSGILHVVSFTPGDEVDTDAVNVNAASEEDDVVEDRSLLDAALCSDSQRSLAS